jgi:hypothetical protein
MLRRAAELQPERARLSIEPSRLIGGLAGESACSTEDRQRIMFLQTGESRGRRKARDTDGFDRTGNESHGPAGLTWMPGARADRCRNSRRRRRQSVGYRDSSPCAGPLGLCPRQGFGISSSNAPPRTLQKPAWYGEHQVHARRPTPLCSTRKPPTPPNSGSGRR